VLLAVPHAGRNYGADLIAAARVPLAVLRRMEDRRADLLVDAALAAGFTAIIADAPRALIDLNRAETDMDPLAIDGDVPWLQPTQRARAGLGLLPHRLSPEGDLWRFRPDASELGRRIAAVHHPWHQAIDSLLTAIRARHGAAVLLDIHSMPVPLDATELALGDRYGRTARGEFVDQLLAVAQGRGLRALRNHPYAGAFGIERHASTDSAVQAVQIEIARSLYLDGHGKPDAAGLARMAALICALARAAADAGGTCLPIAAE
jgi:N-formylglutamate amidohydrolase